MTEKIIMYDSDEAATYKKNLSGWVSSQGRFFGEKEDVARYDGCTHKTCECGNPCEKSWIRCKSCRDLRAAEKYAALPSKKWAGEPLVIFGSDEYFFDEERVMDYVRECDGDPMLMICEPNYARQIEDYGVDELPEDMYIDDIDPALAKLIANVNEYISKEKPILSYREGDTRAIVELQ
jgi:hypothetical protein